MCACAAWMFAVGCGASVVTGSVIAAPRPAPTVVTDATFAEALRHYLALTLEQPERIELRERLVTHLLSRTAEVLDAGDYAVVVEHLARVTDLYTPREIADGLLPAGLDPVASYLVDHGSPRGDEARVLSALLVLRSIHADDPAPADQYRRIKAWGFDARDSLNPPLERFEEGLIEAWEEHARLTPTPEVLETVARLYVERRNAMLALNLDGEQRLPFSQAIMDGVNDTAVQLAGVYLRHGDIASAITQLRAFDPAGGVQERLIEVLETAQGDTGEASAALLELAHFYLRQKRADVARGLCLVGLRGDPADARFPRCLAGLASAQDDFLAAMAWYAEAVRLMPDERALYDETLAVLSGLMERGLFDENLAQARALGARAAETLAERMRRWPDTPPAVKPEELYLAMAVSEMNAGNAVEAEARLRSSIAAQKTLPALLQLGLLLERVGRASDADAVYRQALEFVGTTRGEVNARRADLLEHLGDAQRAQGQHDEASKTYQQALALWGAGDAAGGESRNSVAQLRRGVLLGRLGKQAESFAAFTQAMELAPASRETYATILAYLAVTGADASFASQVFRNAMTQLSLEPEWKGYFALWLRMIAGRASAPVDSEVAGVFEELSQGKGWWAKLAQHGSDKLAFDALLKAAANLGQRTEAYFYEGARRLRTGDTAGAREMFGHVLQSNMVSFYEFAMAQQLIEQSAPPAALPASPSTAAKP